MYMHFYMQTCIFLPAPSSGDIFRDFGYRVSSAQTASGRHVGHFLIYIFFIIVLVDALEHFCLYSWEFHHPNWFVHHFSEGWRKTNHQPERWPSHCTKISVETLHHYIDRVDEDGSNQPLGSGGEHIFMACEKCVCNHISHAIRCFFGTMWISVWGFESADMMKT